MVNKLPHKRQLNEKPFKLIVIHLMKRDIRYSTVACCHLQSAVPCSAVQPVTLCQAEVALECTQSSYSTNTTFRHITNTTFTTCQETKAPWKLRFVIPAHFSCISTVHELFLRLMRRRRRCHSGYSLTCPHTSEAVSQFLLGAFGSN